jgi:hypothetical protein
MTRMRLWRDSLYVFGFSLSCFLPDDRLGLLVLLRIDSFLLACSTNTKDNDVNTVHVYNQSTR